jgi:hypothetical protein
LQSSLFRDVDYSHLNEINQHKSVLLQKDMQKAFDTWEKATGTSKQLIDHARAIELVHQRGQAWVGHKGFVCGLLALPPHTGAVCAPQAVARAETLVLCLFSGASRVNKLALTCRGPCLLPAC